MAQNVTEVFRAKVPSVGLVLKARADIGGKQDAYCTRIREDAEKTKQAVDAFTQSFKKAVQDAAKITFSRKEKPKTGASGKLTTREDIMKIQDRAARQKAIRQHPELFR